MSPLCTGLRRTALLAIAAALVPTALAAQARPAKTAVRPRPNVILITIDTLRADHVGCYGAQTVKTPTLDGLARDGVVFERAVAQVPLTWPSHAVILTGTYPFQNGVQDFTGQPLAPQFKSVAQAFQQAGYATGAIVSAFVLDRSWGLGRGFDYYDDAFSAETFQKKEIGLVDRRADESVSHALAWLKKTPRRPFFLWLHLYDPHNPYDPPEPYSSEYKGHLYDGEIAYADHELGRLIDWLKASKLYDSSLIVATSDHGESLGEHGEDEHGFFLYHATTHVPLILKPPAGSGFSNVRRREPAETTAIAATLLKIAGIRSPIEQQFQAKGLFDSSPPEKSSAYSETFYPFSSFGWSPLHALDADRFHFIDAPRPELYDTERDSGETRNLADEQPATVAVMKEALRKRLARNPFAGKGSSGTSLNPDAQEKLRALGYFGFRTAVSPEQLKAGLSDPKDKIWEFNAILRAQDSFQRGDADKAEALLTEVQQRDPNMYVIPFLLGEAAIRKQEWEKGAQQLERCLELNPNFDNAMTGLAHALVKLERPAEGRAWLDKAVRSNPQNYRAWYQLGLLAAAAGDRVQARAGYEKAVAIQPNFPPGQRELGMLLFAEKNYAAAAPHLEKTIALGLEDAKLHNFLGICYSRTGRTEKAIDRYRNSLRLDPSLAEAHLNLAFGLQRLGKTLEAQNEYRAACKLQSRLCELIPASKR